MTCQTCEFCDTSEATKLWAGPGAVAHHVVVGICTLRLNYFHGKHVPDWMTGCPDHSPVALPQGDGDMGDAA